VEVEEEQHSVKKEGQRRFEHLHEKTEPVVDEFGETWEWKVGDD